LGKNSTNVLFVASENPKKLVKLCAFFLVMDVTRYRIVVHIEHISQHVPDTWTPQKLSKMAVP
jgi:hypothetical protein